MNQSEFDFKIFSSYFLFVSADFFSKVLFYYVCCNLLTCHPHQYIYIYISDDN